MKQGLFTKEIDEAQLSSQIDVSIHSLKDLPTTLPKGLEISAVLPRGDPADIAITKENQSFFELKKWPSCRNIIDKKKNSASKN